MIDRLHDVAQRVVELFSQSLKYLVVLYLLLGSWCFSASPQTESDSSVPVDPTRVAKELPFSVPEGIQVDCVAADALVHDCFSMTTDALGRPIVSGPGYIKTLVDDNKDGIYDRAILWSSQPKQGAQGLWSEGRKIYWIGDGAMWLTEDANGDLAADPNAKKLFDLPTGGEHDAHAIRRGPDGYWYIAAGNFANGVAGLQNDPNPIIARPRAGTVWRISPDFATRSVWAHGMRNVYDFDFLPDGQLVTFDSDCEREAVLPWYRPTRVMVLGPGSDAGWCGQTWKDPDYRVTMPQTIASLGRGSPTGVVVYEHTALGPKYKGAVFVLDWTFGRVLSIFPSKNLPEDKRPGDNIPAEVFMQTTGTAGFAPTDACVTPDGSLLICVGGRGTAGAIYRVRSSDPSVAKESTDDQQITALASEWFKDALQQKTITEENAVKVTKILNASSPWESWSEAQWRTGIDRTVLDCLLRITTEEIELNVDNDKHLKLRAAHVLTRLGVSVPAVALARSLATESGGSHAAAWWLIGRGQIAANAKELSQLLSLAVREPKESASTDWGMHLGEEWNRLRFEAIGIRKWNMSRFESFAVRDSDAGNALRRTWLWSLSRTPASPAGKTIANRIDQMFAKRLFATGQTTLDTVFLDTLAGWVPKSEPSWSVRERMEFLTMLQVALGERRGTLPQQTDPSNPDVLDGYRAVSVGQLPMGVRKGWVQWTTFLIQKAREKGNVWLESEAIRTLAMLESNDPAIVNTLVGLASETSHPTYDLQLLCAIARCSAPRDGKTSERIAKILVDAIRKIKEYGLSTDNQWPKRMQQLVAALTQRDAAFGGSYVQVMQNFCDGDLVVLSNFPVDLQAKAKTKLRAELLKAPPETWSTTLLRHALQSQPLTEEWKVAIRDAVQVINLRSIAVEYLSSTPSEADYETYLAALSEEDRDLWSTAWKGFQSLPIRAPEKEWLPMAKLASHVMNTSCSLPKAAVVTRCRLVATAKNLENIPKGESWQEWEPFLLSNLQESEWTTIAKPSKALPWRDRVQAAYKLAPNFERGKSIFESKCLLCHGGPNATGPSALGPGLTGVTSRFSRDDLASAIFEPSKVIPDRYRSIRVLTVDDEIITGMLVYTAADGTTLYNAKGEMVRINKDQIQQQGYSTESIMPSGLLDDNNEQELADLFGYLSRL